MKKLDRLFCSCKSNLSFLSRIFVYGHVPVAFNKSLLKPSFNFNHVHRFPYSGSDPQSIKRNMFIFNGHFGGTKFLSAEKIHREMTQAYEFMSTPQQRPTLEHIPPISEHDPPIALPKFDASHVVAGQSTRRMQIVPDSILKNTLKYIFLTFSRDSYLVEFECKLYPSCGTITSEETPVRYTLKSGVMTISWPNIPSMYALKI